MIDTRVLSDERPLNGIRRLFHFDDETDQVTIETQQTIDDTLRGNQILRNAHDERTPWVTKGLALNHVASVPLTLLFEMKKRGIDENDQSALRDWLNDPDNVVFRTRPGRV